MHEDDSPDLERVRQIMEQNFQVITHSQSANAVKYLILYPEARLVSQLLRGDSSYAIFEILFHSGIFQGTYSITFLYIAI